MTRTSPITLHARNSPHAKAEEMATTSSNSIKKKQVSFAPKIESWHYLFTWMYASRRARIDDTYQQDARDRDRFKRRIERTGHLLNSMLSKKIAQGLPPPVRGTR